MTSTPFAFLVHPDGKKDIVRRYGWARFLPPSVIERLILLKKPSVLGEIRGIRTPAGLETHGVLIGIPRTTRQFVRWPDNKLVDLLLQGDRLAADWGAKVGGLGAYTAMPGDGGRQLNVWSAIPWTTGNTNTTARAIAAARKAMKEVSPDFNFQEHGTLAVVGATGAIGEACALALAPEFARTILVGRDFERTEVVQVKIGSRASCQTLESLRQADVVVTATSAESSIIRREHITPGTIVVDVARPRDVSARLADYQDVLVIEGGIVQTPGEMESTFRFGLPLGQVYACMEETMLLSLEERSEAYTIGKGITLDMVLEMEALGNKHGFTLAGFRTFDRPITAADLASVREAAAERTREVGVVG